MHIRLIDVAAQPKAGASFRTLTLPRVAGCTPPGFSVSITDGRVERIRVDDGPADLVGLTFSCNHAPVAYDLARRFRLRGAKVVAGGTHATAVPDEALQHVDAVLSGEAEGGAWERLLEDFRLGRLGGVYRNQTPPDLVGLNPPRVDLLKHKSRYLGFYPMEATRGCTHDCGFCFNSTIHGERFRVRPVDEVVADVRRADCKRLMFMDDNLCGKPAYARELFEALIPEKKHLFFQTHLLMAEDEKLVELAARAGAKFVFVGIESFQPESLKSVNKGWNKIDRFRRYVDVFHEHGIFVSAGMILGLDSDGPDCFERTLELLDQVGVDNAAVNLLIPYPGTAFHEQVKREGRLLTDDYSRYTGFDVVVKPKSMSVEELEAGYAHVNDTFFGKRRYVKSIFRNGMVKAAPVYALAWWREPRRKSLLPWQRGIQGRGGEAR